MRLIGQLGDQQKVIATEAIGVVVLPGFAHIGAGEGDAIEFLVAFVLPDGDFDPAAAFLFSRGG